MHTYPELIQKIFGGDEEVKTEALKKLIYLAVNDHNNFISYAATITKEIATSLDTLIEQETKLLSLQLLSQIATNYTQAIPTGYYNFEQLIALLSDENSEVRKSSHYLLLIYIKKYQKIDEVLMGYMARLKSCPEHWKTIQKIIHSFQSLLVIEPRCVTYSANYSNMDDFIRMLLAFRVHQHALIQKASQETVTSLVKNQYAPEVLPKLNQKVLAELKSFATKMNIKLKLNKKAIVEDQRLEEIQEIKISVRKPVKKKNQLSRMLEKLDNEPDWKIKSETIEEISKKLQSDDTLELPDDLVDKILDLTYDYNFKTCITAMNVQLLLVTSYPKNVKPKMRAIEDVTIDKICDLKMAVRQIANKILRKLYASQPHPQDFIIKIFKKLSSCSMVGKQELINFLQEIYSNNPPEELSYVLGEISNQLLNENIRIKSKTMDCLVKISISNDIDECKMILQRKLNKTYYDMFLERLKEKVGHENKFDRWEDKEKNFNKGMTWQAERNNNELPQFRTKVEFTNNRRMQENDDDIDNDIDNTKFVDKFEQPIRKKVPENQTGKNLYTTSTSHKTTTNTFDTFQSNDEVGGYKLGKKGGDTSKQTSFMSFEYADDELEEKKIAYKPNPIKKKDAKQDEEHVLVIKSKEYIHKNQLDEIKEEKPVANSVRVSKLNRQKKEEEDKSLHLEKAKEPFSIKKSASKKDHQVDYKATHYTAKEELAPVDNPKEVLKEVVQNLPKDSEWSKQFDSLDGLRRLIRCEDFYPTLQQSLPNIMPELLKLVESLRSTLAKNAMMALSELCEALKKSMDHFLESIFTKLFKKAQDANTFIVQEVIKCITYLCSYCSTTKICSIIISNCQAKAIPVKIKVGFCIEKVCEKKGFELPFLKENPKLVGVLSNFIMDGSVDVRNQAKKVFIAYAENNSKQEMEAVFRKLSQKDAWEKWKHILDKEVKGLAVGF